MMYKIGNWPTGRCACVIFALGNNRAWRHMQHQIFVGWAIHAFAVAVLTMSCTKAFLAFFANSDAWLIYRSNANAKTKRFP